MELSARAEPSFSAASVACFRNRAAKAARVFTWNKAAASAVADRHSVPVKLAPLHTAPVYLYGDVVLRPGKQRSDALFVGFGVAALPGRAYAASVSHILSFLSQLKKLL
jgi:hypothetical protein